MSLYYLQKFIYDLNRSTQVRENYENDSVGFVAQYDLTEDERNALQDVDVGLLYVMGVNGQLLMHYVAYSGVGWDDYIQAMKDGLQKYGAVRAGLYAAVNDGHGGAV